MTGAWEPGATNWEQPGQRKGDGPSHNGGDKAGALSRDHGSQGDTDLAEKLMVVENEDYRLNARASSHLTCMGLSLSRGFGPG